jgi:hypothetical protein
MVEGTSLLLGQAWVSVGRVWRRSTLVPAPFSPNSVRRRHDQREAATLPAEKPGIMIEQAFSGGTMIKDNSIYLNTAVRGNSNSERTSFLDSV